jgi:hypothetical protein
MYGEDMEGGAQHPVELSIHPESKRELANNSKMCLSKY